MENYFPYISSAMFVFLFLLSIFSSIRLMKFKKDVFFVLIARMLLYFLGSFSLGMIPFLFLDASMKYLNILITVCFLLSAISTVIIHFGTKIATSMLNRRK
jgi:energy-converting hydrogenase Eha subunit C